MSEALRGEDLVAAVLDVCDRIPPGRVASYGDIAQVVGCGPRQVGRIMRTHGQFTCWWRVVRADGTTAVADKARVHWDEEGIVYDSVRVDMVQCRADF